MDYTTHPGAWERDPIITPVGLRSEVASGRMAKWMRFNNPDNLVWVTAPDGRMVALTRKQVETYGAIRKIAGTGERVTMRSLASVLGCAPSTVYRSVIKLTSLGFVAYQSNRGRHGGMVFLLRVVGDDLDWCRTEALSKVRRWAKAAEARISRLRVNVASMFPGRERELYQYRYTSTYMDATNTAWTAEEIREALGEAPE